MLHIENTLINKGFKAVIGLDEVGRGSLAGPVLATAVYIQDFSYFKKLKIKDSKKMTEIKRNNLYKEFLLRKDIFWGIGMISHSRIDKINILEATKEAMLIAITDLENKAKIKADYLLIDGNFKIGSQIIEESIEKADENIISCKLAGIIAKVIRDKKMIRYSKIFPQYGFEKHKGYGTLEHKKAIKKNGFCLIHRKTFKFRNKIH